MLENILKNNRLIVSVVKKGAARKTVDGSKKTGAEGGTILLGQGGGFKTMKSFLGFSFLSEREVILTIVGREKWAEVWHELCELCTLDKKVKGLAFTIDLPVVSGVCHLCDLDTDAAVDEKKEDREIVNAQDKSYNLIITIVNKGDSEIVIDASRKSGARGGTILFGRGTGIHEHAKLLGINIEPEKEIVLTLIEKENTEKVLKSIVSEARLDKPGHGITFVIDVAEVAGISELENLK